MPETKRRKVKDGAGDDDPLRWTGIFSAGLKLGIPYDELIRMHLPVLLMMLESQVPIDSKSNGVRKATQADINAFAAS